MAPRKYPPVLSGQRYGLWTTTESYEDRRVWTPNKDFAAGGYYRTVRYRGCICDCGNKVAIYEFGLASGKSKGCRQCRLRGEPTAGVYSSLLVRYKRGAALRELKWALSVEEFVRLIGSSCFYCGEPPRDRKASGCTGVVVPASGLDRVDSSRGYEVANVVSCCSECNQAKGDMDADRWASFIERLVKFARRRKHRPATSDET